MSWFFGAIGYQITHPQAIIYQVSTALLYPVLFLEVAALAWIVFEFGRFTVEVFSRKGKRSLPEIEASAREARDLFVAHRPSDAVLALRRLRHGTYVTRYVEDLGDGSGLEPSKLLKILGDLELQVSKRIEQTRMFVRFGPILGLMGTLIPISPALVGLARGVVETLSANLVIAFSTTVDGLLIGGLAYLISVVRERYYTQDISDIEYILDILGLS